MSTTNERRTARGHLHVEAFHLMWYACPCGHRERYWNSRDGVTPFGTLCPSCGEPDMQHVDWGRDVYAPDHKPTVGQRVWTTMTRERAESIARLRLQQVEVSVDSDRLKRVADSIFHEGDAPDMVIWGYAEDPSRG